MSNTTPLKSTTSGETALRWANIALIATVWSSSLLFGLYILAFFIVAAIDGDLTVWNSGSLPDLYEEGEPLATAGIGLHFTMGGLILILGSIQLIDRFRNAYPKLHRFFGKIYVGASLLTAIGGLAFIAVSGTVGGTVMNIGFGLYGILMFVSAVETFRHARAGRYDRHQLWSWRLYALAIGSWLYRMEYGFWFLTAGFTGVDNFTGWFDQIMAFFFYVPNLIIVEMIWRARQKERSNRYKIGTSVVLIGITIMVFAGSYVFLTQIWAQPILSVVGIDYTPPNILNID